MTEVVGDVALARAVGGALGKRPGAWAAAACADGQLRVCASGTDLSADFEIGSISKAVTGLLYAEAIGRGEVTSESTLGSCLAALRDAPIGTVTLAALSTHTSGLPRLAPGSHAVRRGWELLRQGANPYRENLDEFLTLARGVKLSKGGREPRPAYSNLGFQLLGHAVAAAAETTYAELVHARVVEPLGLSSTYVPTAPDELRAHAVTGTSRSGRRVEPWANDALGPAGGVRASIADLATLLTALLDGSAPGIDALDPVRNFTGKAARIGAGWLILETPAGQVTWHNGGTGGFRSWLGLDRQAGAGFAVVSANTRSVDRIGFDYLAGKFPSARMPT